MNNIILTREQIGKLTEIINHYKEVNRFTLEVDHSSGIGTGISVRFDLFAQNDTVIDITDYKNW